MMTTLRSKIGALLVKPALKKTLKTFDLQEYGGAPLLGLNGLVVKTHGSSKAIEIKNSILQCVTFKEQKINEKIKDKVILKDEYEGPEIMEYDALRKVTAAILGMDPEEIRPDMTFLTDLGADSLDVYQIVMGVEEELGITIPAEKVEKIETVQEAVDLIKSVK